MTIRILRVTAVAVASLFLLTVIMRPSLPGLAAAVVAVPLALLANRLRQRPVTIPAVLIAGIGAAAVAGLALQLAVAGTWDAELLGYFIGEGVVDVSLVALLVWGLRGPLRVPEGGGSAAKDGA